MQNNFRGLGREKRRQTGTSKCIVEIFLDETDVADEKGEQIDASAETELHTLFPVFVLRSRLPELGNVE